MAEEEATQRSPQLLELVSKSKRELEKRLDQITNKGDIRDKDEGDTICMIIVVSSSQYPATAALFLYIGFP
jgi:hypothetical protein